MKQTQFTFDSAYGNGKQTVTVFTPDTLSQSNPLLLCADGITEVGTTNFAGNSIGDQLQKGKTLPGNFIVVNVHKAVRDGSGSFQANRFKDAIDWALKNYPTADPNRVYVTGLSLSGGGVYALMTDAAYCKKIAASAPVAGTQDADDPALIAGIKGSAIPFRAYGSSTDNNPPTQSAFTHYLAVETWVDGEGILKKYGTFIDTKTDHGGVWAKAYDFTNSDLFSWFLSQSRSGIVTPPVVIPPVVTPPVVTPPAAPVVTQVINVYSDGTVKIVAS